MKRTVSAMMLFLLILDMLTLAFNIQTVKASGTVYIRADGSIDPPTAPISTVDNVTYTFTGNINDSIVVERSNIIIDGNGYTLQGTGSGTGIDLTYRSNVTVANATIKNFEYGVWLESSNYNSITANNITENNYDGIYLYGSSNTVSGNNITANSGYGIYIDMYSSNNTVSGNTITANSYDGISIEMYSSNNIVTENTITGNNGDGIILYEPSNITVSRNNITNNEYGIFFWWSFDNIISGNNIINNDVGIYLHGSSNNSMTENNIANNGCGIELVASSDNNIYHNNFVNNPYPVYDLSRDHPEVPSSINTWDDGYPSGGNYWSDYEGVDEKSDSNQDQPGSDGVGDTAYAIDVNNTDRYPLIAPINVFDADTWNEVNYYVDVVSNSTISDFYFNPDEGAFLRFSVSGETETGGFCRVTIPKDLLWVEDGWTVYVGDELITDYVIIPHENCTYLYFAYNHTTKIVIIQGTDVIPEFPQPIIQLLLAFATLIATVLLKKKRKTKP
jgi:parallel beta-helix repeat protein